MYCLPVPTCCLPASGYHACEMQLLNPRNRLGNEWIEKETALNHVTKRVNRDSYTSSTRS